MTEEPTVFMLTSEKAEEYAKELLEWGSKKGMKNEETVLALHVISRVLIEQNINIVEEAIVPMGEAS